MIEIVERQPSDVPGFAFVVVSDGYLSLSVSVPDSAPVEEAERYARARFWDWCVQWS